MMVRDSEIQLEEKASQELINEMKHISALAVFPPGLLPLIATYIPVQVEKARTSSHTLFKVSGLETRPTVADSLFSKVKTALDNYIEALYMQGLEANQKTLHAYIHFIKKCQSFEELKDALTNHLFPIQELLEFNTMSLHVTIALSALTREAADKEQVLNSITDKINQHNDIEKCLRDPLKTLSPIYRIQMKNSRLLRNREYLFLNQVKIYLQTELEAGKNQKRLL